MTELIEIMFWFGSERNVRWSDDSRREYEWSQRTGELHETMLPMRRKQRRLSIQAKSTLLAPMVYQM